MVLTHFPLKLLNISSSLRRGTVVTIWNFHRIFDESLGNVGALSLCAYSTIKIEEFSTSTFGNKTWLENTLRSQETLSKYTLIDAIILSRIFYQLERKWVFLPYSILEKYAKRVFEKLNINFSKQDTPLNDQFEAHIMGKRCPTLGNCSLSLKNIPSIPTIKEIKEGILNPKLGLMYCKQNSHI